jgi:signal transduction histidine kinase
MRERAELMGAALQIESRQGEGTRILLRLPGR